MRSSGLTAAGWAVITEYIALLQPSVFFLQELVPVVAFCFLDLLEINFPGKKVVSLPQEAIRS